MNAREYKLLEYNNGNDDFWLVGNVVMQGEKFVSAEIIDTIVTNIDEVNRIRGFLDEVAAFIDGGSE